MTDEKLFTVREIANKYRVSEETVRRWCRNGDIPFVPVGPFKLRRFEGKEPINDGKRTAHKVSNGGTEEGT